jgi:hypothetical protein
VEHFEDDDDNDNDSNDVEDVSVHGIVDNTSLSPATSNIILACDFRLPLHPAVPGVILNDLCERIGDPVKNNYVSAIFVASYARPAQPKRSASAFRLKSKKTKRLATSTVSIRQALNC